MSMRYCPYCGASVQPDSRFCPDCGAELSPEAVEPGVNPTADPKTEPISSPQPVQDPTPQPQPEGDDKTSYVDSSAYRDPWGTYPQPEQIPTPQVQPPEPPSPPVKREPKPPIWLYILAALGIAAVAGGLAFALLRPGGAKHGPTYTVLFETQGGTSVPAQQVKEGERITSPVSPTKDGYTFDAWYLDAQHNTQVTFPYIVTEDVTLYAGYTDEDTPTDADTDPGNTPTGTYTVSFETLGGSTVAAQTVSNGSQLVSPQDPTRDGYTFIGWFYDAGYTSQAMFPITVTSSMTLFAKWESDTPEVASFLVNTNDCLNVRSNPGVYGSEVYYQVHPGVTIYWYGEQQQAKGSDNKFHPWYYVNIAGTDVWGWVSAVYLSPGEGTDGPPPAPGERLTINSEASGLLNVRAESTYYSESLWELEDGDMVYWNGVTAEGRGKSNKNRTWYYVNVAGTNVWGWVAAMYMTSM